MEDAPEHVTALVAELVEQVSCVCCLLLTLLQLSVKSSVGINLIIFHTLLDSFGSGIGVIVDANLWHFTVIDFVWIFVLGGTEEPCLVIDNFAVLIFLIKHQEEIALR